MHAVSPNQVANILHFNNEITYPHKLVNEFNFGIYS